jgi:hypothetical protein
VTSVGGTAGERASTSRRAPTWPRVAVVGAVLVLAFVVSRSCAKSEIQVSQGEALATATALVDFAPENPQIRLLRQGLDRHPYWIVSLSTVSANGERFTHLATVRIDAGDGKVVEFNEARDQPVGEDADDPTSGKR